MALIHYTPLLAAIIGAVLAILAFVQAKHKEHRLIEICLVIPGGFLISASMLIATSMTGALHSIRGWNLAGLNILLALTVWCAILTYYGAIRTDTADRGAWHYLRTPVYGFLAGLGLPLWSLHGLRYWGVGIILLGASAIIARRQGIDARIVCCITAAVGAGLLAAGFLPTLGKLRTIDVYGGIALLAVVVIFGWMLVHKLVLKNKYHWWRTPAYVVVWSMAVVICVGTPIAKGVEHGAHATTTELAKFSHRHGGGDYGNPFDIPAKMFARKIASVGRKTHGHGGSTPARTAAKRRHHV